MASEIRVNKIENRSGLGTVTFADTGVDLAGIVTATTFSGSGASLTNIPSAQLTGALPAISGANLTGIAATDNVRTGILDVAGVATFRGDVNIPDKIVHLGDTDTAIRFSAADTVSIETGGVERVEMTGTEVVFNDTGANTDFRIEGDNDANLLKIDASADAIGVGAEPGTTGMKMEITRSTSDAFVNASDCVLRLLNTDTSANTNQTSLQFTTSTTGSGADSAIVSQAEDASGNSRLEFWTDTGNGMSEKMTLTSSGNLEFNAGYGSLRPAYGVRAWANYDHQAATVRGSAQLTSVTDTSTGRGTLNWAFTFVDQYYAAVGTSGGGGGSLGDDNAVTWASADHGTTTLTFRTDNFKTNTAYDSDILNVVIVR